MHMNPVSISLSSFGADLVRQRGQAAFVPLLAACNVARIELREELLTDEDLPALASTIRTQGLECLYSSPMELWLTGQPQPNPELEATLQRAQSSGARWLKVSLGNFTEHSDLSALGALLSGQTVKLLVENDQTSHGGIIAPFCDFLAQAQSLKMDIGMTFDVGNWQWQDQNVISAAQQLGRYVRYVHFKAVTHNANGKPTAIPPAEADLPAWRELLAYMPDAVPRAIEYPLQGDDLLEVTRHQVNLLASLVPATPARTPEVERHV
ncbi:AP endonuclease [Pseudomonas sp. CDFA 602]|uniref:sugar phosphate isomerase/epimerase family protein n=1 Tax=Pseudomonas californiensis TaxID=2829823 RepID=UPI001E3AF569|nr:AP endonuclease [Pseudomonas californiensis]MCD5993160.1 AP endonuclease [Pseudomonas californiensis]MCD5998537.1 AP endonuclease [Pseudomonas californiensis]